MYENIKNLNYLKRNGKCGIYKRWLYKDNAGYQLICDYLQKVNFSVQDINNELKHKNFKMKEIVYIISLIDWIKESYRFSLEKLDSKIRTQFKYSKIDELKSKGDYLLAMRSFIVAHPLNTSRHKKFIDGDFICIDLRRSNNIFFCQKNKKQFFYIDFSGFHEGINDKHQYFLISYSNKIDENMFVKFISFDIKDLLDVARIYIDAFYELDKFLSKTKRKELKVKNNEHN